MDGHCTPGLTTATAQDGFIRWISLQTWTVTKTIRVASDSGIVVMVPSPDYRNILVETEDRKIYAYRVGSDNVVLTVANNTSALSSLDVFRLSGVAVTTSSDGLVQFWNTETRSLMRESTVPGELTAAAASPFSTVLAVGSATGVVRIYDAGDDQMRLLMRERAHSGRVNKLLFDPSGRYLVSIGADSSVYLYEIFTQFSVVGYLTTSATPAGCAWKVDENENGNAMVTYRIEDILTDLTVMPSHLSPGRESFHVFSIDRKLKLYTGPAPTKGADDKAPQQDVVHIGSPMYEYQEHEKPYSHTRLSLSREWLFTHSPDGTITVRTLMEPDKVERVFAHDPFQGGVRDVAATRDCRTVITIGEDKLLRFWNWASSGVTGRRAETEVATIVEGILEAQKEMLEEIAGNVADAQAKEVDAPDSLDEKPLTDVKSADVSTDHEADKEDEGARAQMQSRIALIRDRLVKAMQKNETLPELERIDREEFVVDFEQRDALLEEAETKTRKVRKEIEEENLKKRVIRNRIKRECWDSMEVIGQSIKSFRADPVTNRIVEVINYPIRRRTPEELAVVAKVKLLRRTQMMVAAATKQTQKKTGPRDVDLSDEHEEGHVGDANDKPAEPTLEDIAKMSNRALLYDPFELTTNERKRTQIVLLKEVLLDIRHEFNERFKEMVQSKKDDVSKIEDKNDRIAAIMAELQIQETIFHPELDDDEVPERIIEVQDSEVKVERFITPEEQKRLEEKARQEEERLRLQAEDNYRERAIMNMMGGKVDDRSETEDKEELVRPDWMNKPKEEMSEEERKQVQEFEKKLAVQKEEQEKYRKALETELRKLQGFINEVCDAYDARMREFFNYRLLTDRLVYQTELKIIKLGQATLFGEDDEAKEAAIQDRLEELRSEKMTCMAEIPDIKKDLERCREEYELAVKRDKEIERQFRKEFHSFDFYFDALLKLFKRRESPMEADASRGSQQETLNPFQNLDRSHPIASTSEDAAQPLDYATDAPEGLGTDLWSKLVDLRDRKISAEQDVRSTMVRFNETQSLVQGVLDESERIRIETERITADLNAFMDYKFLGTYDLENLFELKQGQVEVPQAPVVTDYSDAVLIHRGVVEKLNETIVALGGAKVDALKEMKDYRKGIHALEWENKMLDFQAEDLVIRTRDIQLLRVTKQMQEFIRSGDEHKQSHEIAALEKRAEYSQRTHYHKLEEKQRIIGKVEHKLKEKVRENRRLDSKLRELELAVGERKGIHDVQAKRHPKGTVSDGSALREIYARRKLVDLAKSQAQDIAILREEVERLRLRTYPAFPARRAEF
ncbi:Cilia- and flagella-associated protein 43 [Borealophlyctis nickersoniae]|nr:Cilia- and flagella-associated protein 43 [Borealophlyctis nickersoniae]